MDVCKSNKSLETLKHGKTHHKSPTRRRFPSPNTTRTPPVPKRSLSTGRTPPPATPPATPPSPTTTELAARKTNGNKLPESLWPSRMRSLSVAFQSNTFSLPVSKKEKPPPQALYDRTLKPSSNVTHYKPLDRLHDRRLVDQSENTKPLDRLHCRRLVDQHRSPSNKSKTNRIFNFVSLSSSEKTVGSLLPSSPNKSSGVTRGVSLSSPSRQLCNSNTVSVLTFIADIKMGKKVVNRIEEAHHLRLLYNRQVQWRFVNAGAEAVLSSQKVTAEKSLINAQRTTSQLQDSVAAKRINICQLKLQLKLYLALNQQISYLYQWSIIEREHHFALNGVIEDLQSSTLRLPVTGCATANIESVKSAVYSAIQVMQTMGSSIQSTLSRLEGTNWLMSELATVAAQERALLDQSEALMASAHSLQVEEYSLRTHRVQLKSV